MRIIPDGTKISIKAIYPCTDCGEGCPNNAFCTSFIEWKDFTSNKIIEITDDEWDEIGLQYYFYTLMYGDTSDRKLFSDYLKELFELKGISK